MRAFYPGNYMSEKIAVVYIGPKPVKKDTITGSRTLFPRLEPVHVDSAMAWQLLGFPDVWVRHEELDDVLKKQQQNEQLRQAQQAQERVPLRWQKRRTVLLFLLTGRRWI